MNRYVAAVLTLAMLGGGIWLWQRARVHAYHYQLRIAVSTPAGRRTGDVVREFTWTQHTKAFTGLDVKYRERGEALVLRLSEKQYLFVLLSESPADLIEMAFSDGNPKRAPQAIAEAAATRKVYVVPSPQAFSDRHRAYPRFGIFANIGDPKSFRLVDPEGMAAALGRGVALEGMTLQVTDLPATNQIESLLPWLPDLRRKGAQLNGKSNVAQTPNDITTIIGSGSFSRKEW